MLPSGRLRVETTGNVTLRGDAAETEQLHTDGFGRELQTRAKPKRYWNKLT